MDVVRGYLEKGQWYAVVHIKKGETIEELKEIIFKHQVSRIT